MIKNKRIAIVGPADYVNKELDIDHGKKIDNFDTVIRLNSMVNLPKKELEKYYGSKFDILISSFWPFNDYKDVINTESNKARYLSIKSYKNIEKDLLIFDVSVKKFYYEYLLKDNKSFFNDKKNISFVDDNKIHQNYFSKKYKLKKSPTTGLMALLLCIEYEPKEIYISGITFYKDNKHEPYYKDYGLFNQTIFNKIKKKQAENIKKNNFGHDVNHEFELFKKLYKNHNITIDNYLKNICIYKIKNE